MEVARFGVAGLEAVEQGERRRVIGRRAAGGDRRAEERRARDERLVGPRRCLADEHLEGVEHVPPLPRRCLARGEAGHPAFENAETSARCERSGGNAAVLRLGVAAVATGAL